MPYVHFTDEQKQRANSVDLADFLRSQGEEITRAGRDWRWERHDSVTIRGSRWYQHSESRGGLAIDFVRTFYSLSFPEAVTMLLNGEQDAGFAEAEKKPTPAPNVNEHERQVHVQFTQPRSGSFKLPEAHSDMRRVFAYLMKEPNQNVEITFKQPISVRRLHALWYRGEIATVTKGITYTITSEGAPKGILYSVTDNYSRLCKIDKDFPEQVMRHFDSDYMLRLAQNRHPSMYKLEMEWESFWDVYINELRRTCCCSLSMNLFEIIKDIMNNIDLK